MKLKIILNIIKTANFIEKKANFPIKMSGAKIQHSLNFLYITGKNSKKLIINLIEMLCL